jgi:hypothetical protein
MRNLWANFVAEFRRGYAEARARAQPAQIAADDPFFDQTMVAAALRGSFDEGVAAEKARVEAILAAPGASIFPDVAADLVRGPATADQAATVLARCEADAATRAGLIKSNILERASADAPTLH